MHVHVGAEEVVKVALCVIIFGFMWRTVATKYSDKPWGQAMAFIY